MMHRRTFAKLMVAGLAAGASGLLLGSPSVFSTGVTIRNWKHVKSLTLLLQNSNSTAYLLDSAGSVVNRWDSPRPLLLDTTVKPLPGARILTLLKVGLEDKRLIELDWNGNVVWEFGQQGYNVLHHDFQRLSDGRTIALSSRVVSDPSVHDLPVRDDLVIEVSPDGQVVWEWSMLEHIDELGFSAEAREEMRKFPAVADKGYVWLFHANSVQALPLNPLGATDARFRAGNVLVSARNANLLFIVERDTGKVVWTLRDKTVGQHHVSMIPPGIPGEGNMLIFDNGGNMGFPRNFRPSSRILEINPKTGGWARSYKATDSERPDHTFFSQFHGSAQKLPSGFYVITESASGRIFEVTPTGQIVWEYVSPHVGKQSVNFENRIYRSYRLDLAWRDGVLDSWWW